MKHAYRYDYKRIALRPLERRDIEALRVLRNAQREYFLTKDIITAEQQEKWYALYLNKDDDIMFAVTRAGHEDAFIGSVALYDICMEDKTAEHGRIMIDASKVNESGLGGEAIKAVCAFGFEVLGLNLIRGVALKTNARIQKVDARVGFQCVGETEDSVLMEITPATLNI